MVWKLRETNNKHRMPKSMVRLIESIANRREVFVRKDKRISFFFWKGRIGIGKNGCSYKNKNCHSLHYSIMIVDPPCIDICWKPWVFDMGG